MKVLVTGGTSGLGLAMASALTSAGSTVALTGRSGERARAVASELPRAVGVELDVPARELCTDNAAMIASAARFGERLDYPAYLGLDAHATGERVR